LTQSFDLAVFWRGEDISIPECLVRSARRVFGPELDIYQLTDDTTPAIPMVTRCDRSHLDRHIMVARLEACARLKLKRPTLFLDADMLILEKFELPAVPADEVLVTKRQQDFPINADYPEYYPEFAGKMISEVMPFVFSFVATGNDEFFQSLLSNLRSLPERFHRWYGDQVSLKQEYEKQKFKFGILPEEKFNFPVRRGLRAGEVIELIEKIGVKILHFKGPDSKHGQSETADVLSQIRLERN
jgi:hypothetical protein